MTKKIGCTALAATLTLTLMAQSTINLQLYPTQGKLSQTKITHFVQDDKGYIWMGTWDGLMRFDGETTQVYKTYPGDSIHVENHRVMHLKRAKSGNLWVSTYGRHCYLFDTNKYVYSNPLAPYGNSVKQLYTLDNGIVWVYNATGQLIRIDDSKSPLEVQPVNLPFDFEQLFDIKLDDQGNEWLLTDQGAYIFSRSRRVGSQDFRGMTTYNGVTYLATSEKLYSYHLDTADLRDLGFNFDSFLESIRTLRNGQILVSERYKVYICHPQSGKLETYPFKAVALSYIYEDAQNRIWLLGNDHELYVVENGQIREVPYVGQKVTSTATDMQYAFEDDYGTLWIQPGGGLPLAYYNEENHQLEQAFTYQEGVRRHLPYYLRSGVLDDQRNLWGNIENVGFCYMTFKQQVFDFVGGVNIEHPEEEAYAMMIDNLGRLWVGWREHAKSDKGTVAIYTPDRRLIGYLTKDGKVSNNRSQALAINVTNLMQDSHGRIWISTRTHGLYLLEATDVKGSTYKIANHRKTAIPTNPLTGNYISDIKEDHLGRIWMGTYGYGIYRIDEVKDIHHLPFVSIPGIEHANRYVRSICLTSDHKILVGHNNGLWMGDLEADTLQLYLNQCNSDPLSLSSNNVTHVSELLDGRIVVSTFGGGINILPPHTQASDTLHFTHLNSNNSDMPDVVLSTLQKEVDGIWVVSENGLCKYKRDFSRKSLYLENTACSEVTPVSDSENRFLYLAARHNVLRFKNKEIRRSRYEPNIVFTQMSIHSSDTSSLTMPLTPADTLLELKADDRNFSIQFTALDYTNQSNIHYAYRIIPKMDRWIPLNELSTVNIADIDGGDYVLEVRSTNADGIWSNKVARMHFVVEKYFTETLLFKILIYSLDAFMLILFIYTIVHRITERRKSAMQNKISEAKVKFITEVTQQQNSADEMFSRRLMRLIQDNIMNESFNMEQAAAELNMSYPVLYRKVKSLMDMTPVELVRQVRMQRAHRLLKERPNLSITEVAYQCGFGSPQYFNRVFKEMTQCTPAEYKKRMKEESDAEQQKTEAPA